MSEYILVITTTPDEESGRRIARSVVERRLAACATLSAEARSFYRWEGAICDEKERVLLIKTQRKHFPSLEKAIKELHPYTVPEIIALPIAEGSVPYLEWIKAETHREPAEEEG